MAEPITPVYAIAANITSSAGMGVETLWQAVKAGNRGIQAYSENGQEYYASRIDAALIQHINNQYKAEHLTGFEKLCLFSIQSAMAKYGISVAGNDTVFILSSTKGNIDLLNQQPDENIVLGASADNIVKELGITTKPVIVSQACVSGAVALLYAQRLLSSGRYRQAIVTGCDMFTPFVLNGFLSFKAIAHELCKPFDANRKGINLGEAAATVILTTDAGKPALGKLTGGATSNDANHISGPSRTGEELADAINRAMMEAGVSSADISMVSAHGTATLHNDEMEAKALHLAGLSNTPVHSMKSYTGHTLGAAGVLESAMTLQAFKEQQLIPSAGYEIHGVPVPLNVTTQMVPATIKHVLKTASGFGGSNAAIVWSEA